MNNQKNSHSHVALECHVCETPNLLLKGVGQRTCVKCGSIISRGKNKPSKTHHPVVCTTTKKVFLKDKTETGVAAILCKAKCGDKEACMFV